MKRKRAGGHVEDVRADYVGGHQISGALDALKAEAADAREGFHRERFADAGNAFHQRVAAADEDEHELINHFALPDHDFCEFAADVRGQA